MKLSWLFALPLGLALASPAVAVGFCIDNTEGGSIKFGIGVHVGEPYTEAEQAVFDQMELRRRGVDATRVERWNGCIRAWVRQPNGFEIMQYFDPNSFRQLD